jgi:hypothetical protein
MLMGILGALLALPVAATVMMLIEELRVELPGQQEQVEDVEQRVGDERAEGEYARRTEGVPAEQAAAIAVEISDDRRKEESRPFEAADVSDSIGWQKELARPVLFPAARFAREPRGQRRLRLRPTFRLS